MTTCAIYARLSRDTESSTSVARQLEACRAFAASRGWAVVLEREDVDVSGSKVAPWDRPGFADVLARRADVVLAYRIDRFARSVGDFAALLRRLEESGTAVVSATEPFDLTSPLGKALLYLVAIFAEMEADAIGARVRSSIATLRRSPRWSHGQAPYGYRIVDRADGPGRTLVLDVDEAAILRELAERVLAGESLYGLTHDLNARGVRPRRAASWSRTVVGQTLASDHLLGRVKHRGELVRDDATGEPLAPFPPILDLDTAERVRAVLAARSVRPGRRGSHLLSGLVRCAGCGGGAVVSSSAGARSYRCAAGTKGHPCPEPFAVKAERLEEHVVAEFLASFGRFPVVERVERLRAPVGVADLDAQIREATAALASAPDEEAEDAALALVRRLKARRSELASAPLEPAVDLVETGQTFADRWAEADLPARRALLVSALEAVDVRPGRPGARSLTPGRVTVQWRT